MRTLSPSAENLTASAGYGETVIYLPIVVSYQYEASVVLMNIPSTSVLTVNSIISPIVCVFSGALVKNPKIKLLDLY